MKRQLLTVSTLSLMLVSCQDGAPAPTVGLVSSALSSPSSLVSLSSLLVGSRVTVAGCTLVSNADVSIGTHTAIRGDLVANGAAWSGDNDVVDGNVTTGSGWYPGADNSVTGTIAQGQFAPWQIASQLDTYDAIEWEPHPIGSDVALAPGTYGTHVFADASTIRLRSGEYNFHGLFPGFSNTIVVDVTDGPVWINTARLVFGDKVDVTIVGGDARHVNWYSNTYDWVHTGNDSRIQGSFTVPSGQFVAGHRSQVIGTVQTAALSLQDDSSVTCAPRGCDASLADCDVRPSNPDRIDQHPTFGNAVVMDELLLRVQPGLNDEDLNRIAHQLGATIVGTIPDVDLLQLQFPNETNDPQRLDDRMAKAGLIQGVVDVFSNDILTSFADPGNPPGDGYDSGSKGDDEFWGQRAIDLPLAWKVTENLLKQPSEAVTVIDEGIQPEHRDFEGRVDVKFSLPVVGAGGNHSLAVHGTEVAGIIAAGRGNGMDIAGVNPAAPIDFYQLTARNDPQDCHWATLIISVDALASAIRAAKGPGATIINWSVGYNWAHETMCAGQMRHCHPFAGNLGTPGCPDGHWLSRQRRLWKTVFEAPEAKNVLIVAAAGNDSSLDVNDPDGHAVESKWSGTVQAVADSYPDNVILVASVGDFGVNIFGERERYSNDPDGRFRLSPYSDIGADIAAPGHVIYSLHPYYQENLFRFPTGYSSGTSMAAPFVTGVASLIRAREPFLTPGQIRQRLLDSAKLGGHVVTRDLVSFPFGVVNAFLALNSCSDHELNGEESDVDCGGQRASCPACCEPCIDGKKCQVEDDCSSQACVQGVCVAKCVDGRKDGTETDVDCGGSCTPCAIGKACLVPADCASHRCVADTCQAPQPQLAFGNPTSFGSASAPDFVAAGDFNGDGFGDVAATTYSNGALLSIYVADGFGSFRNAQTSGIALSGVHRVEVGDFNKDGRADLLMANFWYQSGSLWLGSGSGTFGWATEVGLGRAPSTLALDDFDHDGNLDFASSNQTDRNVMVVLGRGNGTFQAPKTTALPSTTWAIASGDLNGDHVPDLVTIDSGLNVLLNDGHGGMTKSATYPVGALPQDVRLADFNGDGFLDAAVANTMDRTIGILLGRGDGTFLPQVAVGVNLQPGVLAVADFDGDSSVDIVFLGASVGDLRGLAGKGDGTFAPEQTFAACGAASANSIGVADFDHNGKKDVTFGYRVANQGKVCVLFNQSP